MGLHGAAMYGDILYTINGYGSVDSYIQNAYSIDLQTSITWNKHSLTMPGSSSYIGFRGGDSVQIGDKLYVINPGTSGTGNYGQEMFIFDLTNNDYLDISTYSATPPNQAHYPCVVYNNDNGLIYGIGGYGTGGNLAITQTYDVINNKWDTASNINTARYYAGCSMDSTNNYIFLFGGVTNIDGYGSSGIERYTVSSNRWDELTQTLSQPTREFDCALFPYDSKIYCGGGRYYGTYINDMQIFDPADYSLTTIKMNYARQFAQIIIYKDCLMVIGGYTASQTQTDTVEYYGDCILKTGTNSPTSVTTSPTTTSAPTLPSMAPTASPTPFIVWSNELPQGMTQHGVAVYGDTLFTVNGYGDIDTYILDSYSISLNTKGSKWMTTSLTMPSGATRIGYRGGDSVQIDDKLYVINPNSGGGTTNYGQEMFIFDLTNNAYIDPSNSKYLNTPTNRAHYPCVVYNANNNIIYVIGGYYGGNLATTQTYNIADKWGAVSDINTARNYAGCAMNAANTYIFLFGGVTDVEGYGSSSIERYTVSSDSWSLLKYKLVEPSREFDCALFPYDSKIYCVGGRYYGTYYDVVQVFNPSDYTVNLLYMNHKRQEAKIAMYGTDCMLIVGGSNGSKLDSIEYYGICNLPTPVPTKSPTNKPTQYPTSQPTEPSPAPTSNTNNPTNAPSTGQPTEDTSNPTNQPSTTSTSKTSISTTSTSKTSISTKTAISTIESEGTVQSEPLTTSITSGRDGGIINGAGNADKAENEDIIGTVVNNPPLLYGIIGVLFVCILLCVIYYCIRQKKLKDRITELENVKGDHTVVNSGSAMNDSPFPRTTSTSTIKFNEPGDGSPIDNTDNNPVFLDPKPNTNEYAQPMNIENGPGRAETNYDYGEGALPEAPAVNQNVYSTPYGNDDSDDSDDNNQQMMVTAGNVDENAVIPAPPLPPPIPPIPPEDVNNAEQDQYEYEEYEEYEYDDMYQVDEATRN